MTNAASAPASALGRTVEQLRARGAAAIRAPDERRRCRERGRACRELDVVGDGTGELVDDPARQRMLDLDALARAGGQRRLLTRADLAQHRVREPRELRPAAIARRGDRIVDGGVRRHAIEKHQLIRRDAQRDEHARRRLVQIRMRGERAIDARAMAQHAVDELGREPAIAIVERGARELAVECRRRPRLVALDTLEHAARDVTRADHGGLVSLSPMAMPRPAASSFAVTRLRPGIWISRTATTPP
jgi:hypothetical protein